MAQVDFPRGGSNVLSPLEVQNAKRKAEDDALFKTTPSTPLKKAKKIKSNTPATAKGKDIPSTDKDEVSVDAITISMYKKGVSVLGIVKEINPVDITVSLPGLLTGYIHITQMSSQMTQLLTRQLKSTELDGEDGVTQLDLNSFFRIGDMLRCVVDEVELTKSKHKRIKLAMDPKILNAKFKANRIQTGMTLSGYIESVEDHGYIVSFEIENLVGFLSQQEGLDYAKSRELEDLPVGLPVNCVIQKVKDQGRMVTVGVSSGKVLKAKAHEGMRFSYDTLQAGLYVNGTIAKISTKGAQLSFLGGFRGSVTADHLNQNQSLQERSKVVARIIYVDRKSKKIALSLLNITVNGQMDISQVEIGQIIEDAVVLRVDKGVGLLLQLSDNLKGYVHISRASDKHIDKFGKQHRAGSKHRCRVIANSLIDELAIITMQQSVLEQQFISYKDIKPGTLVMGKIISLEDFGILVQVTDHIKALCPRLHMSDITLKHPEKKFKEGNKIKCRVLTVDARRRRLILTHKKSMVHSSHVVITSYEEAQENVTAHGFISSVRSNGCFITFYNNVRGFVHKKYLSTQYIENPETVFFVGQVVLTYIVSVDAVNKKLSLSLKPPALTTSTSSNLKFNQSKVVDVDLFRATAEGLDVLMQPSGLAASVPVHHLSDFHSNSRALVNYFTSQQSVNKDVNTRFLKQLVTVGKTKSSVIASRKQSLVDAVQNKGVLQNFDQLKVGLIMNGFIKLTMDYGCFVEFPNGLVGLAPIGLLSDGFVDDISSYYSVGDSVIAKVTDIEHERKRFLVSLRLSDYLKSVGKDDAKMNTLRIFDQYLNERNTIIEAMKCVYEFPPTGILIGELVTGMIEAIDGNRVTLLLKKGQKAVSTISFDNADLKENSSVSARVIDFDLETRTVVVSLHPDMVSYSTKQFHKMQKQIKVQTNTEAIIELVTCDHIVCRLPNYRNILAVAPSSQYWNNVKSAHRRYSIGNRFTAHVERVTMTKIVVSLVKDILDDETLRVSIGQIFDAKVEAIRQFYVMVKFGSFFGTVHITEIVDEIEDGCSPLDSLSIGCSLKVRVINVKKHRSKTKQSIKIECSAKPSIFSLSTDALEAKAKETDEDRKKLILESYKPGDKLVAYIHSIRSFCIHVFISRNVKGKVFGLHASKDENVLRDLSNHFKVCQGYNCSVLSNSNEGFDLSIAYPHDYKFDSGSIIPGRIINLVSKLGAVVQLPLRKCGVASLTNISDKYQEDITSTLSAKQIVRCYTLKLSPDYKKIDVSLRPSRTNSELNSEVVDKEIESINDIASGQIIRGYIKGVSKKGVFVALSSAISGRIKIKNLSDKYIEDWMPKFKEGMLVTAKVISVDLQTQHVELSLKESVIKGASAKNISVEAHGESVNDESDAESIPSEEESGVKRKRSIPDESRLTLSSAFQWSSEGDASGNGNLNNSDSTDESQSDSDDNVEGLSKNQKKRRKRAKDKAEEAEVYQTELALVNNGNALETPDDFDRLVISEPNNSSGWLQYMAYYLQTAEIDKSRDVAERALKTISFRESQHLLNIWIAMMNLENLYGTQETLTKVFERAVQRNDPKDVFFHLSRIYIRSDKHELADKLFQNMIKRFNTSKKVWIRYGQFLFEIKKFEGARKILQRSLKSLPKRKHLDTIVKFAQFEFKYGDHARGATIFESVLSNYPKRTDLWSVYIDMVIKVGDIEQVRKLFEKVVKINLSSKKIKFLFKRYMEFESKYGNEESVEHVKQLAVDYVSSQLEKTG